MAYKLWVILLWFRRVWSASPLNTMDLKHPYAHVGSQATCHLHFGRVASLDIVLSSYLLEWKAGMWEGKLPTAYST